MTLNEKVNSVQVTIENCSIFFGETDCEFSELVCESSSKVLMEAVTAASPRLFSRGSSELSLELLQVPLGLSSRETSELSSEVSQLTPGLFLRALSTNLLSSDCSLEVASASSSSYSVT